MQKALKITGIIFGILLALSTVGLLIAGFSCVAGANNNELIKSLIDQGSAANAEAAKSLLQVSGTTCIVLGVITLIGCALSFAAVHFSKKDDATKGSLIALGVLNILFCNEVVGVISIIHGAKNGK